jgi:hypothetical protein
VPSHANNKKSTNPKKAARQAANQERHAINKTLVQDKGLYGDKRPSKLVRQYQRTKLEDYAARVKAAETERKKIAQKVKDDAARAKRTAEAKAERQAADEARNARLALEALIIGGTV